MKDKYISTQSSRVLNYFHEQDRSWFETTELNSVLPFSSPSAIRALMSDMVRRGLLMRLKRGLYYIIPFESDPDIYMPDWHLVAEAMMRGRKHYIGYYSALQIHDLITQPSLQEQIVVSNQMRPSKIKVKRVTFQFIYHNKKHFFGEREMWINSFDRVKSSNLEKTIIDCLFKPEYAGGVVEIAKAIYASRDKLNFIKLLEYTERFGSQAVIKRLGFLLEAMQIKTEILTKLQSKRTASYVLLDTELPKSGKLQSRWRIQKNLEISTIQGARST